jgi:hypothetical protein
MDSSFPRADTREASAYRTAAVKRRCAENRAICDKAVSHENEDFPWLIVCRKPCEAPRICKPNGVAIGIFKKGKPTQSLRDIEPVISLPLGRSRRSGDENEARRASMRTWIDLPRFAEKVRI